MAESDLLHRYKEYALKRLRCLDEGNLEMHKIYGVKMKEIRATLSLLGIHIDGINR